MTSDPVSLAQAGDFPAAVASARQRLAQSDGAAADWHLLGGMLEWSHGDQAEAESCFRKAHGLAPDHRGYEFDLACCLLAQGKFAEGWRHYEARAANQLDGPMPAPRWEGGPLEGKTILLRPEQGFGDLIQLARFTPALTKRGAKVILGSLPQLGRLMAEMPGKPTVFVPGPKPPPRFDLWCPYGSLPLLCGGDDLPPPPYLSVPPALAAAWSKRLGEKRGQRIGIVWGGSPDHAEDRIRSPGLEPFLALMRARPDLSFVSLQVGPAKDQLLGRELPANFHDVTGRLKDFLDTAAVVDQLDLVIAPDTAVAHLAGALGKPVWLALAWMTDWRWQFHRADSPWYPSARLFRQDSPGDWSPVFAAMQAALA